MKKIGILTSGGDSPGMNAAVRAVVRRALYEGIEVCGIRRGYEGLIKGDVFDMDISSVADIIHRGGTFLGTARSLEFKTDEGFQKARNIIDIFGIDGMVVIGGDGSMAGAQKLSNAGIPTIGIPGTIDNDLGYTEYSIGFHTAVNTVLSAIGNIRDTSTSHGRANIIEVMGRACGDIALYAGVAGGAESILIPEKEVDMDTVCKRIINGVNRGKLHSIIILAEGAKIDSKDLVSEIESIAGMETRMTVLGHIQRGGIPTAFDRIIASKFGSRAVELLKEGIGGRAVGIQGTKVIDLDINEALSVEKVIDQDLYEMAEILSR